MHKIYFGQPTISGLRLFSLSFSENFIPFFCHLGRSTDGAGSISSEVVVWDKWISISRKI
jgi:hypothetical protein